MVREFWRMMSSLSLSLSKLRMNILIILKVSSWFHWATGIILSCISGRQEINGCKHLLFRDRVSRQRRGSPKWWNLKSAEKATQRINAIIYVSSLCIKGSVQPPTSINTHTHTHTPLVNMKTFLREITRSASLITGTFPFPQTVCGRKGIPS